MSRRAARVPLPAALELERIIGLKQVEELSSLSEATIKRRYADKLIELSPRRLGMRLRDALMLSEDR
jgi:hypothetical protein